tara:strand:+ start:105 stop:539 length:435 start_codon:yes stop_codon:yes gene_type:complete
MSSYYCLVTSDTETKFARDIINSRLKEKKYPLYKKTPFLNEIKKNDDVVFYLAGKGENSQSFVATAKILSIETIDNTAVIDPDNNNKIVIKYLNLDNINFFEKKINIKSILDNLNFIKNKKHYGVTLVGGVSKIKYEDFKIINK